MKKIIGIILSVVFLITGFAYAAGPCGDFEYAELKDMDQQSFLKEYCKMRKTLKLYANLSMLGGTRQDKIDYQSCSELNDKMERIYMKRFGIENREELVNKCK